MRDDARQHRMFDDIGETAGMERVAVVHKRGRGGDEGRRTTDQSNKDMAERQANSRNSSAFARRPELINRGLSRMARLSVLRPPKRRWPALESSWKLGRRPPGEP